MEELHIFVLCKKFRVSILEILCKFLLSHKDKYYYHTRIPNTLAASKVFLFVILSVILISNLPVSAFAASSGPNNPTSGVNLPISTNADWVTPGNALISDNVYATVAIGGASSDYLNATGFGFTIPVGATIDGIVVDVERKTSSAAGTSLDNSVKIIKGGAIVGTEHATATSYTASDTTESHGTSADLWGTSWTSADINAANFGGLGGGHWTAYAPGE